MQNEDPVLPESSKQLIEKQGSRVMSAFDASRLEKEAKKHWDKFYKRNTVNFFKGYFFFFDLKNNLNETKTDTGQSASLLS